MPVQRTIQATLPGVGAAVLQDQVIGEAPYSGQVAAVVIVSEAAVALNATNFRTFRLVNKGQAGAGTTVVASLATSATSLVAFDETAITLSVTAADLVVAQGDVLAADETVAASGVAHSGYQIRVEIDQN